MNHIVGHAQKCLIHPRKFSDNVYLISSLHLSDLFAVQEKEIKLNSHIDFCPSFNSTEIIGWRQNLVYNASFSYRLIDIIADKMNTVDISVYWTSQNGNEHDFYLPPASSSQIKLAFIKKSVIKFQ